jgi:MFS family permease
LAIAIQNLAWCIATPLFGACAEKFGDKKAIFIGIILYAVGLLISSQSSSPIHIFCDKPDSPSIKKNKILANPERIELPTSSLGNSHSIQLSYGSAQKYNIINAIATTLKTQDDY